MNSYVHGFLMSYDLDKFLLLNKGGFKMNNAILKWQGPGGKILLETELDYGETPHEAMARKFLEETNTEVKASRWHCFFVKQYKDVKVYFFVCFCSPSEIEKAAKNVGDDSRAKAFTLVDVFWEPVIFTFDIPYLINMIIYEFRAGCLLALDPEGINSNAKKN